MDDCPKKKKKKARTAQDPQLEKAVFTWFNQDRSEGMPISGSIIQAQAKKTNQSLHGEEQELVRQLDG